jgi:G3E family GTPase
MKRTTTITLTRCCTTQPNPNPNPNLFPAVVKKLNTHAKVITSVRSQVDLAEILSTNLFNLERARMAPGWLKELRGTHVPETEEYGISSFVFRAPKPFHPERLAALFRENRDDETTALKGVVRSKGYAWLATERGWEFPLLWEHAGHRISFAEARKCVCLLACSCFRAFVLSLLFTILCFSD